MSFEEDPAQVLAQAGLPIRRSGSQYETDCPFCEKKRHLYMNPESGLWDCKRCGEKGNLYQFKEKLGLFGAPPVHVTAPKIEEEPPPPPIETSRIVAGMKRLLADAEAMRYLRDERGFDEKVVRAMGLILETWKDARWIGFPWRQGQEWKGIKFRILPKDAREDLTRFRRLKGYPSILYNVDVLEYRKDGKRLKSIILASGETDALALLSMGYRSVVATTVGETSFKKEWIGELQAFDSVFIVFDSDPVGREAAEKLARKIGVDRARVVRIPTEIKDANEFLKRYGAEAKKEFDLLLRSARKVEVPTIHHIVDLVDKVRGGFFGSDEPIEPYTPWDNVNEQLSRLNGLVVLSAPQNVGKTTFGLNICDHWAARGKPSLFYCLEMTEEELTAKVIMAKYDVTLAELKANTDNVFERFAYDYVYRPFFIGYNALARKVSDVVSVLREAIDRHNLQIVFFDNIHIMARSRDARYIVGELSAELKGLAMQTGATVVAIAQPRKIEIGRIMDRMDVKESVDLLSDADNMIILHRQKIAAAKDTKVFEEETDAVLSPYTLVRIEKTRFGKSKDCILYLDGEHHRFRELYEGEEVEYRGARGTWKTSDRKPEPAPVVEEGYNPSVDW